MIPSLVWDNEEWIIRKINNMKDGMMNLKYCDGKIKNIIFDLENLKDYKKYILKLFLEYYWIEKIIIMNNKNIIKVLKRA